MSILKYPGVAISGSSVMIMPPTLPTGEAKSAVALLEILGHLGIRRIYHMSNSEVNTFAMRHLSIESVLAARLKEFIGMKNTPETQARIRMMESEVRAYYASVGTSRKR